MIKKIMQNNNDILSCLHIEYLEILFRENIQTGLDYILKLIHPYLLELKKKQLHYYR